MYNVSLISSLLTRFLRLFPGITFALLGLACAAPALATETLFYTGDPNNVESIGDYNNPLGGSFSLSQIFEPFTVTDASGWDINSVYFNELDLSSVPIASAEWSIRTGMAPGVAGLTVASGMGPSSGTFGSNTTVSVSGLNVVLGPGTYWLNVTPNSTTGRLFANSTSGANSQNAHLTGAALWYEPGAQYYTVTNADFSVGAAGNVVPEPSTFWLALPVSALCAIVVFYRRRAVVS